MFLVGVLLLTVGFAAAISCFHQGNTRAGWVLICLGALATVAVVVGTFAAGVPDIGTIASLVFAVSAIAVAARIQAPEGHPDGGPAQPGHARRTLLGAVLGIVPGALITAAAILLHELDVITADQSQFGFIGIPLAVVGMLAGALIGATYRPRTPPANRPPDSDDARSRA